VRRALAAVAAVGMVVAAVAIRSALDDDEGSAGEDRARVIVCAEDLIDHCRALGEDVEVRAERAEDTAAAIQAGDLAEDVDGWITTSSWAEVLAARAPDAAEGVEAVASTPTTVATAPGRADAIADLCRDRDPWECLGTVAGEAWADLGDGSHASWGTFDAGVTDPRSAVGLSVLASAAVGWFGGPDFAANDLDAAFQDWLALLADASAGDADPARTMAVQGGAAYSAAGTVAATAAQLEGRGVGTLVPAVEVDSVVVAIGLAEGRLPELDEMRRSLEDEGWATADEAPVPPTLAPGVMAALLTVWKDVAS